MVNKELFAFEKKEEIQDVIKDIVNFLEKNPPTLGHGFYHFVKVARNAYYLSQQNSAEIKEIAYVAGLLHDLYRTADSKAGKEIHETTTAKIAERILSKSHFSKYTKEIIEAINGKDDQ